MCVSAADGFYEGGSLKEDLFSSLRFSLAETNAFGLGAHLFPRSSQREGRTPAGGEGMCPPVHEMRSVKGIRKNASY